MCVYDFVRVCMCVFACVCMYVCCSYGSFGLKMRTAMCVYDYVRVYVCVRACVCVCAAMDHPARK